MLPLVGELRTIFWLLLNMLVAVGRSSFCNGSYLEEPGSGLILLRLSRLLPRSHARTQVACRYLMAHSARLLTPRINLSRCPLTLQRCSANSQIPARAFRSRLSLSRQRHPQVLLRVWKILSSRFRS